MQLNQIPLDERTEKALRLCARVSELTQEMRRFVGEANLGYDDGLCEVRKIASEGVIKATRDVINTETASKA